MLFDCELGFRWILRWALDDLKRPRVTADHTRGIIWQVSPVQLCHADADPLCAPAVGSAQLAPQHHGTRKSRRKAPDFPARRVTNAVFRAGPPPSQGEFGKCNQGASFSSLNFRSKVRESPVSTPQGREKPRCDEKTGSLCELIPQLQNKSWS